MKRKDFLEFRKKDTDELKSLLKTARKELNSLLMNIAIKKERNVHVISQKKDEIAKILTLLKEKEINK